MMGSSRSRKRLPPHDLRLHGQRFSGGISPVREPKRQTDRLRSRLIHAQFERRHLSVSAAIAS
jgi:hypothetical protein